MIDCLVVGGGVIGLSLAYELAGRGFKVEVVDRREMGKEASWAGAGILPPANRQTAVDPLDQLRGLSHELHERWARDLQAETGIDTGYSRCGGVSLARSRGEAATLIGEASMLQDLGIAIRVIDMVELGRLEPAIDVTGETARLRAAYLLPDECQLRNPAHLRALVKACEQRGVRLREGVAVESFCVRAGQIQNLVTAAGELKARSYCITAGPWTRQLLTGLDVETGILPMRGQMVLFKSERQLFQRIVNEGHRYLVPRTDGRVLAGSTEEEEGFDKSTTQQAFAELTEFAYSLVPALRGASIEAHWAGLRPASFDGLPYLGRIPDVTNGFVAAGHFRSGLHLSTGTAVVMAELIAGLTPQIDLSPFQVSRGRSMVHAWHTRT